MTNNSAHSEVSAYRRKTSVSELVVTAFYLHSMRDLDRDAIDAGANSGTHTRMIAHRLSAGNGKVLAIEPNTSLHTTIEAQCRNELLENFLIDARAVGPVSAQNQEFVVNLDDSQISSLATVRENSHNKNGQPAKISRIAVNVASIEDLVDEYKLNPSFLKLDIEGADADVLFASRKFIAETFDSAAVELAPWNCSEDLFIKIHEYYSSNGFIWLDHLGHEITQRSLNKRQDWIWWNRFLLSEEHPERKSVSRNFKQHAKLIWAAS